MGRSCSDLIPTVYWDVDMSPVPHSHDGSCDNGEITQLPYPVQAWTCPPETPQP